MKHLLLILLLSSGCVSHFESPITHTSYTGTIDEDGIGIVAKIPGWDAIVYLYELATD